MFWNKIRHFVIDSFKEAFRCGTLSTTQKRAIITLIHKGKELPREDMNSWRAISLCNNDYKLLAKTLALRLSYVIKNLISEDQVGFMKGRQVSSLLRLIDDVVEMLDQQHKPGLLVTIDYFHAFDCISKEYMLSTFKIFGFGDHFIRWVSVLMNDAVSCINYCGWLSEPIAVESGIRQGCPFSPLAFILSLELLAIKIRASNNVKGIHINDNSNPHLDLVLKLLLYADDITMFFTDEQDMQQSFISFMPCEPQDLELTHFIYDIR